MSIGPEPRPLGKHGFLQASKSTQVSDYHGNFAFKLFAASRNATVINYTLNNMGTSVIKGAVHLKKICGATTHSRIAAIRLL